MTIYYIETKQTAWTTFTVEAESEEEARLKFRSGDYEIVSQQVDNEDEGIIDEIYT